MDQYDDLDPEGSCFAQIQALVQSEFGETKQTAKSEKETRIKPGRSVNHDSCDSCGEGGDLLCCDQCPCAFHLTCCDPPLEEDDIPTGEWLCNECKSHPLENGIGSKSGKDQPTSNEHSRMKRDQNDTISSPFQTLVKMSSRKNPSTFTLPPELTCHTYFPGDRKRKLETEEKVSNTTSDKKDSDFDEGCHLDKLCFACSKTARNSLYGDLIECDFCPLSFHTNCLQPPLTNRPAGMWMCPNHAEHAEPGLKDPRFSRRLKAYDELRNNISQHTIKMDFLDRVHRLRKHPDFDRKQESWKRKRLTLVPESIKWHYKNPPFQQLPEHVKDSVKPLPSYRLPVTPPKSSEQEEWLKAIVSLQCDIAKHFASLSVPKPQDGVKKTIKAVISGTSNHVISNNKIPSETSNSNSSETKTLKTLNSTSNINTSTVKTVTTTKPNTATAKVVTSSSTSSAHTSTVTSFSRVVTTHTVTSGGKTLTKPITILYASPSKNLTQQNGVSSNMTKHLNNTKPIAKVEGTVKKPIVQQTSTKTTLQNSNAKTTVAQSANIKSPTNSKANLIQSPSSKSSTLQASSVNSLKTTIKGDLKTLSNGPLTKPRTIGESTAVKPRTIGESTKAVSVSPPGTNNPRTMSVVGTVSTGLNSGNGATKVIVLTNTGSGNIIKSIATTTTSAQRTVGSSGSSGSTTTVTSPSVQRIVVQSSPQKGLVNGNNNGVSLTTSQAASPVSTICAVSGLDNIQESELSKLDPRLVHVLAYQRLQQLITQTTSKVNPTNSTVARKISFNSSKETVVLPQNVPRGKAMAVLCPMHGEGASCPMIYKTLNIGQGPDMDVCLRNYGYCNYLSDKHCSIFYDEATKQYELLNYSEHGTYVDNVLYSCDFSDKPHRTCVTSARKLDPSRLSKEKLLGDRKRDSKDSASRRTAGLGIQLVTRPCNCSASSSTLIGGSGAGWEGTATLHHGSYVKMGCLQFVFSIVNQAGKFDVSKKIKTMKNEKL